MKRTIATLSGALLATTLIAVPSMAQDNGKAGSGDVLLKNNAAQQAAPGQQQKTGAADTAKEAAPGQQQKTGAADTAKEAAPGQQQKTGAADKAKEAAPGQQQKTGAADTAKEAAPGQQQKTGVADTAKTGTDQMQTSGQASKGNRLEATSQPQATTNVAPAQTETSKSGASASGNTSDETTASINITTEQRTELKKAITTESVEPANVDVQVDVGVVVPRTVKLHRLPARVVELVPVYDGYEYFVLADGRIVIVEPDTLRVVYIIT